MSVIPLFTWQKPNRFGVGPGKGIPAIVVGMLPLVPTVLLISGVTRDSTGAVLTSCTVTLYRTLDDAVMERVTSDAVTGAYSFRAIGLSESYYVMARNAAGPVMGVTVDTLLGTVSG